MSRRMLIAMAVFVLAALGLSQPLRITDPPGPPWKQLVPGKDGPASVDDVKWVKFTDPNEHAFTIDVPDGWETAGGAVRRNAWDVSGFLRMIAPDRSMMMLVSDPGPQWFHTSGFAHQESDRGYATGKDYARLYGNSRLPSLCVKFESDAERLDLEKKFSTERPKLPPYDVGESVFSCTHQDRPARAYILAATFLVKSQAMDAPSYWGIGYLVGWVGPEDQLEHGKQMVRHLVDSTKVDEQWQKAQNERISKLPWPPWASLGSQTPEWEAMREKAAQQMQKMAAEFNPQPATASQP